MPFNWEPRTLQPARGVCNWFVVDWSEVSVVFSERLNVLGAGSAS